jgi:deazaflavin-dependent oxidoreductase (nitroreductase family)
MKPERKRKAITRFQKYALNPVTKHLPGILGPALLETKGRTSGKARRTPVGVTKKGGAFWVVSEHGRHSQYVKNIKGDPHVRVRHRGKWHDGVAHLLPHENARSHTKGLNGLLVRLVGTELLAIRIDPRTQKSR